MDGVRTSPTGLQAPWRLSGFCSDSEVIIMAGKLSIVGEFWRFIKQEKKFWMIPLMFLLGLLALFVVVMQSPWAPFLYPFF